MKYSDQYKYSNFQHALDIDAFERAINFEPLYAKANKHGEEEEIGHCPDPWHLHKHGDTSGKLAINKDKKVYNCWVCGGGSLLSLAMGCMQMSEQEAEDWLYQFASDTQKSDEDFMSEIDAILYQEKVEKPPLPYFNEHVLDKWEDNIGKVDRGWLRERGIDIDIAVKHHVGFDPEARRMAPIKGGERKDEPYTGPSIYFPHFWGGRLVGWQQRWLDDERPKWLPKYTNTSDFPKNETIFNYESVYLSELPIIVVESVPTVLFLESVGYPAVATFGSSVTDEQMRLLRKCQQGVVIAPDNDEPGRKWVSYTPGELEAQANYGKKLERVILAEYLARYIPVKVIEPVGEYNDGSDLGDLVEADSYASAIVRELYESAEFFFSPRP